MKLRLLARGGLASALVLALALSACSVPEWLGGGESVPASDSSVSQSVSEPEPEPEPVKPEYQRGVISETGYESVYHNLRFTPPENVVLATDEEIAEIQKQGAEAAGANSEMMDLSEGALNYEFLAVSADTQSNLIAITEYLRVSRITPVQYLAAARKMNETQFTSAAVEYDEEPAEVELAGRVFGKQRYKTTIEGSGSMWQETYVTIADSRALVLTLSYKDSPEALEDREKLLSGLTALDAPGSPESGGESGSGSGSEIGAASGSGSGSPTSK